MPRPVVPLRQVQCEGRNKRKKQARQKQATRKKQAKKKPSSNPHGGKNNPLDGGAMDAILGASFVSFDFIAMVIHFAGVTLSVWSVLPGS